ncbi:MAG: iron-containing alcohol dehydrogenase family protein [bacterium]
MELAPFQVILPPRIKFGWGQIGTIGPEAKKLGNKVMVVTGRTFLARTGILDQIRASLEEAGVEAVFFQEVEAEPSLETIERGRKILAQEGCDLVIGVGGGSSIDAAKAIAGLAREEGTVWDYFAGRAIVNPGLPWIAVPTTAGTGAEATKNSVLSDYASKVKKSIRSDYWVSSLVIWDPELTTHMSPRLTAATGMDALTQAIESYTSRGANPFTDSLVRQAISLIGNNILTAYREGQNREAREKMALGCLLAGIALANARLGVVHGIAHPVGILYKLAHGLVCGVLLPYAMDYNLEVAAGKYADVAALMGLDTGGLDSREAARMAIDRVRELGREMEIPARLGEVGLKEADFSFIIKETMPSGSTRANPREVTPAGVEEILRQNLV